MNSFLFLSLTILSLVNSKCPDGMMEFARTPTAKNNYTKSWCMVIDHFPGVGNRDIARGLCSYYNATLTMPEDRGEFMILSMWAQKKNITEYIAMDGEVSPHCKPIFFSHAVSVNPKTVAGDCNIMKNLFTFDSANTDPTFMQTESPENFPYAIAIDTIYDIPIKYGATCLIFEAQKFNVKDPEKLLTDESIRNHTTQLGQFRVTYCNGIEPSTLYPNTTAVLCGRHPL